MNAPTLLDTLKEGWVSYRREIAGKKVKWKKRWAVVGRKQLRFYVKEKDVSAEFEVLMTNRSVAATDGDGLSVPGTIRRDGLFKLLGAGADTVYLAASSADEREQWIRALRRAIMHLEDAPTPRTAALEVARSNSAASHLTHGLPSSVPRDTRAPSSAVAPVVQSRPSSGVHPRASIYQPSMVSTSSAPTIIRRGESENEDEEAPVTPQGGDDATFSLSGEQLLLTYRYMRDRVNEQAVPKVLYMPAKKVYRRFGLRLGMRKLVKMNPSINAVCFESCLFGGDFFVEFCEALALQPEITRLVFIGEEKAPLQDSLPELMPMLPPSICSVCFQSTLTRKGVNVLLNNLALPVGGGAESDAVADRRSSRRGMSERIVAGQFTEIELVGQPLRPFQVDRLAGLAGCLVSLNLARSSLGDGGAWNVLTVLGDSAYLERLSLAENKLTRVSRDALVAFLRASSTLRSLNLSNNRLADAADALFELLAGPEQRLAELNLADNRVPPSSASALSTMLQRNTSLTALNLDRNKFRDENFRAVTGIFAENESLCRFTMGGVGRGGGTRTMSPAELQLIHRVCHRNEETALRSRNDGPKPEDISLVSFETDYTAACRRLMHLLGIRPSDMALIVRSCEYERCSAFVAAVAAGYSDRTVDHFVNERDFRDLIGINGMFVRHMAYLFYLTEQSLQRSDLSGSLSAVKEGYMFKRGGRRHNWKRRWFSLSGFVLQYYVAHDNLRLKGTVVLEDAVIQRASRGAITAHAIEIVTPARTYVLACDSEQEAADWQMALLGAHESALRKEVSLRADSISAAHSNFCRMYEKHARRLDDPHRRWAMQYWYPLCLEAFSLYRAVPASSNDEVVALVARMRECFHEATTLTVYILAGEHLFDYDLVSVLDGERSIAKDATPNPPDSDEPIDEVDNRPEQRLDQWCRSALSDLRDVLFDGDADFTVDVRSYTNQLAKARVHAPQVASDDSLTSLAREGGSAVLLRALQPGSLSSVYLHVLLSDLPETVLEELLGLRRRHSHTPTAAEAAAAQRKVGGVPHPSAEQLPSSTRRFSYDAVAPDMRSSCGPAEFFRQCVGALGEVGVDAVQRRMTHSGYLSLFNTELQQMTAARMAGNTMLASEAIDETVVCLWMVPSLQHLREPVVRLLTFLRWLSFRWPSEVVLGTQRLTAACRAHALRLVFILRQLFRTLVHSHVPVCDMAAYLAWTRFASAGADVVIVLGSSAFHAFPRSSEDLVQVPLSRLFMSCIAAILRLVSAEITAGSFYAMPPLPDQDE